MLRVGLDIWPSVLIDAHLLSLGERGSIDISGGILTNKKPLKYNLLIISKCKLEHCKKADTFIYIYIIEFKDENILYLHEESSLIRWR